MYLSIYIYLWSTVVRPMNENNPVHLARMYKEQLITYQRESCSYIFLPCTRTNFLFFVSQVAAVAAS